MTGEQSPSFLDRYRKQILLALLGAIVLWAGGDWLVQTVLEGPLEEERQRAQRYEREIEKREKALSSIRQAGNLLKQWEGQSLPADRQSARSLYQAWLVELVDDCRLEGPSVTSGEPSRSKAGYFTIACTVRARGTLEQFTRFLYAFYETDLLHKVRSISLTPVNRGEQLDVSLAIEAMGLPGAGPAVSSKLSADERQQRIFDDFRRRVARTSAKLASSSPAAYDAVFQRNLFAVGGSNDPTDTTFLTSIVTSNGRRQVWLTLRATDEVLKLHEGDALEVGQFHGRVLEIHDADVILESSGERWLLTLGENLVSSTALPPEW